jgi:hypothetical protein
MVYDFRVVAVAGIKMSQTRRATANKAGACAQYGAVPVCVARMRAEVIWAVIRVWGRAGANFRKSLRRRSINAGAIEGS